MTRGASGAGATALAARVAGSLSARTASASDETGTTSSPDTIAASPAFGAGSRMPASPSRRAAAAIGSTPRVA